MNIMIVDDHSVVRLGISNMITTSTNHNIVGEASSIESMLAQLEKQIPDLILLDNKLPDGEGIDAVSQLKSSHPQVKIIILTAFTDATMIKEALRLGADGYLLKNIDRKQILNAIETVSIGGTCYDASLLKGIIGKMNDDKTGSQYFNEEPLTTKEQDILRLVSKGLKNKEIAQELFMAEKTVRNYLSRIMKKINVSNRTEAALYWQNHFNK